MPKYWLKTDRTLLVYTGNENFRFSPSTILLYCEVKRHMILVIFDEQIWKQYATEGIEWPYYSHSLQWQKHHNDFNNCVESMDCWGNYLF